LAYIVPFAGNMEGITVTFRRLLGLALIAGMPGIAGAQFTTFIPPVDKTADSVKAAVVAEQQVQRDSIATAQMTNMKTWVDSAAGIAPIPVTPADSVLASVTPAPVVDTATFVNGMRAPATASDLPLLFFLGLGLIVAGVAVVVGEPRRQRARVRARSRSRGA
jgi:hypothetical protein